MGEELGGIPAGGFRSPEGDSRFSNEAGVRPLNNLVFELLNVESPHEKPQTFRNPRDGWLYLKVSGNLPNVRIRLDQETVELREFGGAKETMLYRSAGPHEIRMDGETGGVSRLEVRAIGDLVYAAYGSNPHIKETGNYSWDFLKQHCLDHYNSMIGDSRIENGISPQEAEIREWTALGKRWYTLEEVPFDVTTAEEAYNRWSNSLGMRHPLMSGIWADELGIGEKYGRKTVDLYPLWTEAVRRLQENPQFAKRHLFSYIAATRLDPAESFAQMGPFMKQMMAGNYGFAPEHYWPESRSRPGRIVLKTEDLISDFSPGWEMASRESFERLVPGAASRRVLTLFTASEPAWESADIHPEYDFNVFLDSQLQFIATDPAYFALRGIQGYHSGYTGEEQLRLFARLVRHYAIEGNTKRLLETNYVLPHLKNPDFVEGMKEWTVQPAVNETGQESISARTVPGLGVLQARFHAAPGTGDTVLWMRRHGARPNVVSQTIRELTPGRLYSLRMLTGDFKEFETGRSEKRLHAVSTKFERGDVIPDKSFQTPVESGYWYPAGGFDRNRPYWLNYHQVVFRALDETAELTLSDWVKPDASGGADGEETIWNFVQIQPYVK